MVVVAILNHKGGVGKTTTAVNLGAALQEAGQRVLLVDLDPQASLTIHLGIKRPESLPAACGHALKAATIGDRSPTFRDVLVRSPAGLDLIPATRQLAEPETLPGQGNDWPTTLRRCLAPLRDEYDYVLIDCLPSRNYLAFNAMTAADGILVPTQTDYLAVQGLALTFQTAVITQQQFNPRLRVLGILLTMVDLRTRHTRWVMGAVRRSFEGKVRVFETVIALQVGFKESSKDGVSVLRYNPRSVGAMAFRSLAGEVVAGVEDLAAGAEGRPAEVSTSLADATVVAMRQAETLARVEAANESRPAGRPPPDQPPDWPDAFRGPPATRGNGSHAGPPPSETLQVARENRSGPAKCCPFLGLADDRNRQMDRPDPRHRCWVDNSPFAVEPDWQGTVCRLPWFSSCPRFARHAGPAGDAGSKSLGRLSSWK